MYLIRVTLALALFLSGFLSLEAAECETPAATAAYFDTAFPGSRINYIKGPRAKRFLLAFNARPPRSTYAGDAIAVVKAPHSASRVYLAIYKDGCIKHRGTISRKLADDLLGTFGKSGRQV